MNAQYVSFMLRIWKTGEPANNHWVASLEDPHTHEVFHFNNLERMWQFLRDRTADEPQPAYHPSPPEP